MTTIPFTPNPTTAPPFSAIVTLNGQPYTLATAWNMYRTGCAPITEGWYMSLTDQNGNLLINQPLIGSPPNANIYLAWGLIGASTLVFRVSTNSFEVGP
jgi:hypothetical protein